MRALLALIVLAACAGAPTPDLAPPNILLITAEDLSPRLGAYGDAAAHTPNLDRLAAQGVTFTRAFATAGVCAPSRSSLITGVHQQTLGTMHMRTSSYGKNTAEGAPYEAVPPPEVRAFPELLRRLGYHAANDAKTDFQFGMPFTVWDETRQGADWRGRADGQPFFAMVNFNQTHESYTFGPDGANEGARPKNARLDARKTHRTEPADVTVPPYYPDTPAVRANIARHYDNVSVVDALVGDLLDRLEADGLADDTVVIFTTDHGDGLPRAKRTVYDSGLRVPLIARWPDGQRAGTVRGDLVSFVDVAPTLVTLAGGEVQPWMQGRVVLGPNAEPAPEHVFAAADRLDERPGRIKAARGERFAYLRNYRPEGPRLPQLSYQDANPVMAAWRAGAAAGTLTPLQASYLTGPSPAEALFDTAADPDQVVNLADDPAYADVLVQMRAAMDAWIEKTGDLSAVPEAQMRAAMWPGGEQPVTAAPEGCLSGMEVVLTSATPGASIGYRASDGWALATGPIEGAAALEAKATRYGYAESSVAALDPSALPACGDR